MTLMYTIFGALLVCGIANFYMASQYSNGNVSLAPGWLRKIASIYTMVILNIVCGFALLISSAISTHEKNMAFKTLCEETNSGTMIKSTQGNLCVKTFILL